MALKRQINATTTARLKPLGAGDLLTQPLFAINWFNTKRAWLYSLYSILVAGPAFRAGAKVFLKAEVIKTLQGTPGDCRDLLLIVNYASGENFLDLLENKYFQIISGLRLAAVKDFSFVFHRRLDGPERLNAKRQKYGQKKVYAIHHFRSPGPLKAEFENIKALATGKKISLYFASERAAALAFETKGGQRGDMPFVTHKIFLFEGDSGEQLEGFLTGKAYQAFARRLRFSYIGLLKRVM
jgi:hypothetical protein